MQKQLHNVTPGLAGADRKPGRVERDARAVRRPAGRQHGAGAEGESVAVIRTLIRGVGAYLPKRRLTNEDLAKIVDTSDEWITERTGIKSRHIAADGERTSDLGIKAAQQALERSGLAAASIDLVICATATPDRTFPATAVRIQSALGIGQGAAFEDRKSTRLNSSH